MNKLDNEIINMTKSFLTPPSDFDMKINNTLKTMYRRETKHKSKFIKIYEKILKFFITLISLLSVTSLAGYTGYKIYDSYIQNNAKIKEEKRTEFYVDKYNELVYGDKYIEVYEENELLVCEYIDNFEEYTEIKNIWENIPQIKKEDFEKNVLLTIVAEIPRDGLKVEETKIIDDTLWIKLSDDEREHTYNGEHSCVAVMLNKNMIRDKIKITTIPGYNKINEFGFTLMKNISNNYLEQALEEHCVITYNNDNKTDNIEYLDKFIEDVNNNKTSAMRMVYYNNDDPMNVSKIQRNRDIELEIIDIIYKDGFFSQYKVLVGRDGKIYSPSFIKGGTAITEKLFFTREESLYKSAIYFIQYGDKASHDFARIIYGINE